MKKILVVFVFVLSSWVVRGEETGKASNVTVESLSLSAKPARFQFVKEISVSYGNFITGILIDTEQGKVWELAGKKGELSLIPIERKDSQGK